MSIKLILESAASIDGKMAELRREVRPEAVGVLLRAVEREGVFGDGSGCMDGSRKRVAAEPWYDEATLMDDLAVASLSLPGVCESSPGDVGAGLVEDWNRACRLLGCLDFLGNLTSAIGVELCARIISLSPFTGVKYDLKTCIVARRVTAKERNESRVLAAGQREGK